jgi:hypothetical protein
MLPIRRRALLTALGSGLVLPSALLASPSVFAADKVKRDKRPVAVLLPLSGPRAALGLSMRQGVLLADSGPELTAYDTGGTPEGAALAARNALKAKAAMILGPVTAEELNAVSAEVARRVPVIAFTNNAVARGPGSFVFGITPAQVTSAVLRYARSRGVRSVVVVDDGSPWSVAAALAAGKMQGEVGLDVRSLTVVEGQPLPAAGDAGQQRDGAGGGAQPEGLRGAIARDSAGARSPASGVGDSGRRVDRQPRSGGVWTVRGRVSIAPWRHAGGTGCAGL